MPDYKAMYFKLFNSVTDAIDILQKAQLEAENAYMTNTMESVSNPLVSLDEVTDDKN